LPSTNFHEEYDHSEPTLPSDRSTGLVIAAAAVCGAFVLRHNIAAAAAVFCFALLLVTASLVAPASLRSLNVAWMKLARLLNEVASPIVLGILFLLVITPVGLLMQIRRDPLLRRRGSLGATYWIQRTAHETSTSMTNQF
jgi:hypothetical protein